MINLNIDIFVEENVCENMAIFPDLIVLANWVIIGSGKTII